MPPANRRSRGLPGELLARLIAEDREARGQLCQFVCRRGGTVVAAAQPGDMILTLGAGSVSQLGPMILEKLQAKTPPSDQH